MTSFRELDQVDCKLSQGTVRYRELGTGQPVVLVHGLLTKSPSGPQN